VNSGTYETVDSTLIVRPLTAKTPEYVGGRATYIFHVEGDRLRLELLDTFAHDGTEDQGIARYERRFGCAESSRDRRQPTGRALAAGG